LTFTIDPGTSELFGDVTANGNPLPPGQALRPLRRTLAPVDGDNVILPGTISADAAALLNTFNTGAVADQLLVGIATITVNTK
jgi:hypothetical protein